MLAVFKAWAEKWQVAHTSIAIMRGEHLIGTAGVGRSANDAAAIASESKAITAMCIAKLVDDGKLTFDTPLGELLAGHFAAHPPFARRAPSITIGQLLTHSSGITYDPSQSKFGNKVGALGLRQTHFEEQATLAFEKRLGHLPGRAFAYNNMNYALLGLVIETVTGTPYETYCHEHVLKPAGVTAAGLNPAWRVMSSWGGWKISAVNYARFLGYFDPSLHLLETAPPQWPKFRTPGGHFYTLGAILKVDDSGSRRNFSHEGKWKNGRPQASFGGYFTVFADGVRYIANYEPLPGKEAIHDLQNAMSAAATGAGRPRAGRH